MVIYLDFNSTAPLLPAVAAAMAEAAAAGYANPASQHAEGRRAHQKLEDAREEIARLLGANLTGPHADRLIFTSGGTEANNLALLGTNISLSPGERAGVRGRTTIDSATPQITKPSLPSPLAGEGPGVRGSTKVDPAKPQAASATPRLIISAIEHPSITAAAKFLSAQGWQIDRLRVDQNGIVELAHLDELLAANSSSGTNLKPALVSVMLANNETGAIQPIEQIVARCNAAGVPVHTDAVQAAGKLPINFRALGVAAMTVAPHKFGGPRGIGALLVRHDVQLHPILHGGAQQFELRPGTESVDLALGFLAALSDWQQHRAERVLRMQSLRDRLESELMNALATSPTTTLPSPLVGEGPGVRGGTKVDSATPNIVDPTKPSGATAGSSSSGISSTSLHSPLIINSASAPRLAHTSNLAFPGHDRQALLMALDLAGICCSTGSACASGSSEPSPTLVAMNLPREIIESSLRFSLGPTTTEADIDEAVRRIVGVARR